MEGGAYTLQRKPFSEVALWTPADEARVLNEAEASRARAAAVSGKEAQGGWLCLAGARLAALPHGAVCGRSDALGQACAAGSRSWEAGESCLFALCVVR